MMAQTLLFAGKVESIAALLTTYRLPAHVPVLMLLEMQPQRVVEPHERQDLLRFVHFTRAIDVTPYTSGRIFHADGELRWEQQPGGTQIVYTGDAHYQPNIDSKQTISLDDCDPVDRQYFLAGTRLSQQALERIGSPAREGDFAEARIPRLLRYPVLADAAQATRLQLVVCEYIDRVTGNTIAFRFKGLVGAE